MPLNAGKITVSSTRYFKAYSVHLGWSRFEYWNSLKITSRIGTETPAAEQKKKGRREETTGERGTEKVSHCNPICLGDTTPRGPERQSRQLTSVNDLRKSLGLPCGSQEDPSDALMLLLNSKTDFLPRDLTAFKFISISNC